MKLPLAVSARLAVAPARSTLFLCGVLIAAALHALWFAFAYANQPPLDMFGFRQAQTALSAFWMQRDGFALAYSTPVAGAPWAIPFEFPIYQAIVALVASLTGLPIDPVARLTSMAFLFGCLLPMHALFRRLCLPATVTIAFGILLLSSPLYLYWGRSMMIETAALFFGLWCLPLLVRMLQSERDRAAPWLFALAGSLAVLQKSTTGLPILAVLGLAWVAVLFMRSSRAIELFTPRRIFQGVVAFALPVALGLLWVMYSDAVKQENAFGAQLTAAALSNWNFGAWEQRWSFEIWREVMWTRLLQRNAGGLLGIALLAGSLLLPDSRRNLAATAVLILLAIVPFLLFTKLHQRHSYYQAGNLVFLLVALSIAIGSWLPRRLGSAWAGVLALLLIVASNAGHFVHTELAAARSPHDASTHPLRKLAQAIQDNTSEDSGFVAFGLDWSSELAYLAQRRSFTVSGLFKGYDAAWREPQQFLGSTKLSALVACPGKKPSRAEAIRRHRIESGWTMTEAGGCVVLLPDFARVANATAPQPSASCAANIELIGGKPPGATLQNPDKSVPVSGWTHGHAQVDRIEAVQISAVDEYGTALEAAAARVRRPDLQAMLGWAEATHTGFSVLLDASELRGRVELRVIRQIGGVRYLCPKAWQFDLPR